MEYVLVQEFQGGPRRFDGGQRLLGFACDLLQKAGHVGKLQLPGMTQPMEADETGHPVNEGADGLGGMAVAACRLAHHVEQARLPGGVSSGGRRSGESGISR